MPLAFKCSHFHWHDRFLVIYIYIYIYIYICIIVNNCRCRLFCCTLKMMCACLTGDFIHPTILIKCWECVCHGFSDRHDVNSPLDNLHQCILSFRTSYSGEICPVWCIWSLVAKLYPLTYINKPKTQY